MPSFSFSLPSLVAAGLMALPVFATTVANAPTRLQAHQPARPFMVTDITGQPVSLTTLKGHKVLLAFMRNVGCPVCNLRMYQLVAQADYFKAHNLTVVAVYESSAENMRKYLVGQTIPFTMVANPDESLYKLYDVEVSGSKAMKSMFHGVIGKASEGKKLFVQPVPQDGNKTRIGAEFLLDEQGIVAVAHYGRYIGDDLPLADIKKFIE
ncbi:redoxin domain-containing protein [Hymenobacter sp. BT664]|uniref:Redoxin domain-containing protein n=1 Tax=Hymenobacter montanus TaxID=2771359 RepID=A0A927GHZ8_9BACT|nr:redoxin domain-containing protein [Hymenobacter montanus]MBD2766840.1 redoxin domain-containing protein [Hymenobacter montanus]